MTEFQTTEELQRTTPPHSRSLRDVRLRTQRCDGGDQAASGRVRRSGTVLRGIQLWRDRARSADRCGPPAALVDWRYLAVSLAAGLIAFFWSSLIEKLRNPVRLLDAMGLAFFAVAGTEKALSHGLGPVMARCWGC